MTHRIVKDGAKMTSQGVKVFFRATEQERNRLKAKAAQRGMTMDAIVREACELWDLIPAGRVDEARAKILDIPRSSTPSAAILVDSKGEAETMRALLYALRGGGVGAAVLEAIAKAVRS